MFAYPCPFCAQRLLASPERAGQRTICPKCLKPIVIPRSEPLPAEPEAAAAAVASDPPASIAGDLGNGFVLGGPAVEPPDTPIPVPGSKRPPARVTAAVPAVAPPPPPPPPPPAPAPVVPDRSDSGMVVLAPSGVESADLAAELTAALTMRMRPPPEPPGDLKLSTGLWLTLTAVGVSLWLYSLLYTPLPAERVAALIGVVEFAIGYFWVVYLDGRRSPRQGLIALLPPVAVDRLLRPRSSQGYRPLRFVVAGVVLFTLFLVAPAVRPRAQALAGLDEPPPPPPPPPAETPPAARLKELAGEKNDHLLVDELRDLADRNAVLRTVTPPAQKADLLAELRKLLKADQPEVRTAALTTLVAWADEDAKPDVLAALKSPNERERLAALRVCGRWKDPTVARAVAARLATREDVYYARETLLDIGKDGGQGVVEDALLPMLAGAEDDTALAAVKELTEQYGGERTVAALKKLEAGAATPEARRVYHQWWQAVARLHGLRG